MIQMETHEYIGQTIGNWRILRKLGQGAFGAVYEAEHIAIAGRGGAVKILRPELSMQTAIKQRFLNEASAASRAEHENIVQVFDGGITPDGTCYQVMELLKGMTLSDLLKRDGRMDAARTINIAAQIAAALGAAHALQIVHRDLKPEEVFSDRKIASHVPRCGKVRAGVPCGAERTKTYDSDCADG